MARLTGVCVAGAALVLVLLAGCGDGAGSGGTGVEAPVYDALEQIESSDPLERAKAAKELGKLSPADAGKAIPVLKSKIDSESDAAAKKAMQEALKTLEARPRR